MRIGLWVICALSLIFFNGTPAQTVPAEAGSALPAKALHGVRASIPANLFSTRGGLGYAQFCSGCHGLDGAGVKGIFPPLAQNHVAAVSDASRAQAATAMPSFGRLSDRELSEILGFVREGLKDVRAPGVKEFREDFGSRARKVSGFRAPRLASLLAQPNAGQLIRGMRLVLQTKALLPKNVGNALNCASCHLIAGTVAYASPFTGVSASFPSYSTRAGRVITIEERINGCFVRSMNGKPLPVGSPDTRAMVAYLGWMKGGAGTTDEGAGRGVGKIDKALVANIENGKKVYSTQCAACHGKEGEGLLYADGRYIYPPLWGDNSFNIGAGMARTYTAAAFTKQNMPIGFQTNFPLGQGGLSDQEAVDVAQYFSHQPRSDFPNKANDWPGGGKPKDARY